MIIGISNGRVMYIVCFQRLAPSIMAASYKPGSILVKAAKYTTVPKPNPFQTSVIIMVHGKMDGSPRKEIGPTPNRARNELTMPCDPRISIIIPAIMTQDKKFGRYTKV